MLNGLFVVSVDVILFPLVPINTTAGPDPFAPAPLRAFLATTDRSAPVLRIGTLASRFSPLGFLPWHQSDWFLQFRANAFIRVTPPLRRSPPAQSSRTSHPCPSPRPPRSQ